MCIRDRPYTVPTVVTIFFVQAVCSCFINVIAQAILVEMSREAKRGASENDKNSSASNNTSLFFGARTIGSLIGSLYGGWLLKRVSKRLIYLAHGALPFTIGVLALFMFERNLNEQDPNEILTELNTPTDTVEVSSEKKEKLEQGSILENLKMIFNLLMRREILIILVFMCLLQFAPNTKEILFFYGTNRLGYESDFISLLLFFGSLASLAGITINNRFLKNISFPKIFFLSTVSLSLIGYNQLFLFSGMNTEVGIPNEWFSSGDAAMTSMWGQIQYMPMVVISARLCPKNIEGTMFAAMLSILNLAFMLSGQATAILISLFNISKDNFDNLWIYVIVVNSWRLIPLILLLRVNLDAGMKTAEGTRRFSLGHGDVRKKSFEEAIGIAKTPAKTA
eukprot:TRINITY_DN5211_c0_g1_i1.p1 TRINITY_DN5211_c0_g1~~TRINITY_DN5211_c0_g1_i1.p1  ORF type:complete len:418 (+),score=176.07 TRINITY_DN5211_c0_g1_i1:74-1255(+)